MRNLIFFFALLLTACGTKHDINNVKKGMQTKDVVSIMGEPDDKVKMPFNMQWWRYGKNQIVVIADDTVSNVVADVNKVAKDIDKVLKAEDQKLEEDTALNEVIDATKNLAR